MRKLLWIHAAVQLLVASGLFVIWLSSPYGTADIQTFGLLSAICLLAGISALLISFGDFLTPRGQWFDRIGISAHAAAVFGTTYLFKVFFEGLPLWSVPLILGSLSILLLLLKKSSSLILIHLFFISLAVLWIIVIPFALVVD